MSLALVAPDNVDLISDSFEMKRDALAFFRQNNPKHTSVSGNMGKWGYSSQSHKDDPVCGGILWDLFVVLHPDYYPKRNQIPLIQKNLAWLHSVTGDVDTILDFGCGGDEAIQNQAIPVLKEFNKASTYVPIDLCTSFVEGATIQVEKAFNGSIKVVPLEEDFSKPIEGIPAGKKLGLFFGASTNFEDFPQGMKSLLASFRKAVGQGGYVAMAIDTNLDPISVKQSYDHPLHHQQEINLIHRLKRDLNISGDLDPGAWHYETDVEELEYFGHKVLLASHVLVAKRAQSFFIDDDHIGIKEGERLIADKSYKIPVVLMDILAKQEGYMPIGSVYDSQNRMAMPVYWTLN